jgi:hypothetical protein
LIAWTLCVVSSAFVILSLTIIAATDNAVAFLGSRAAFAVFGLAFLGLAVLGALVASRHADNPIGWLLEMIVLAGGLILAITAYVSVFPDDATRRYLVWTANWIWTPVAGSWAALLVLFPTGRPPSSRWRLLIPGLAGVTALQAVTYALGENPGQTVPYTRPLVITGADPALSALQVASNVLFGTVMLGALVALISRARRARGVERQQLKWVAYSAGVLAAFSPILIAAAATHDSTLLVPSSILGGLLFMNVLVSMGIAILRYRLYDIDLLINRTVVYGATSATIVIAFLVGVLTLQALLRSFTGGSELAVAASTLASFALFQPIRRRVQDTVDRRFYRARYDASRTLDNFAKRLSNEVDLDALRSDLLDAVHETMAPASMSLWLRERPG